MSVQGADRYRLACANCGDHLFSGSAYATLPSYKYSPSDQARLAYAVRRVAKDSLITSALLQALLLQTKLPPALERIDNVIEYLALGGEPGESKTLSPFVLMAAIGASSAEGATWAIGQAMSRGYITGTPLTNGSVGQAQLTAQGWQRFAELTRQAAGSKHAFMAMKFGDAELDNLFRSHLMPAVAATGFTLRRLDGNHATAGSIDNRMRVELRTSRFVVCDLTHANLGAYWEAGFAEGLGRPVFYICRQDQDGDRFTFAGRPHFDVNHQLIIPWRADDPAAGMQQLKDAIRATLPSEARMEDA